MPSTFDLVTRYLSSSDIVYLSGPCVGKSTYIKKLLDEDEAILHGYVDCLNLTTPMELYKDIFDQFISQLPTKQRPKFAKKLTSVADFAIFFRNFRPLANESGRSILCVVFDNVDTYENNTMIDGIGLLSTVNNLNLVVISRATHNEFVDLFKCQVRRAQIESRLAIIDLPPLSIEEMIGQICKERPATHDHIYDTYVNNVVNLFYGETTLNFVEIINFCQANFGEFIREYELKPRGKVTKDFVNAFLKSFVKSKSDLDQEDESRIDKKVHLSMGILIIATYVAAYTSPVHDKVNFVLNQAKRSTRIRDSYNKSSNQFTQQRLIQIHKFLMKMTDKDSTWEPDKVLKDIKILEDLGMIIPTTRACQDIVARYKISHFITKTHYETLSKNFGIEREIFGLQV